jgi:hypothetical protein
MVHVHFKGWAPKWDMKLQLDSPDLQPLFTYTDNWRAALAVGSQVEASCLQTDADSLAKGVVPGTPVVRWYEAVVKEVDLGECALASALPCVSCASRCNCCC